MLSMPNIDVCYGSRAADQSTQGVLDWQMLQERKSPNDTTSWDEIPEAWA